MVPHMFVYFSDRKNAKDKGDKKKGKDMIELYWNGKRRRLKVSSKIIVT